MSHQTGITANDELKKFFGTCNDGSVRSFKVSIFLEELTLDSFNEPEGSWEEDYDNQVLAMAHDGQPAYIFFRLDSKTPSGYEWLLICWSPDKSQTRQKMLYASTKATLKREFGSWHIKEELHGTVREDVSLDGFKRYKKAAIGPAPLTIAEEVLAELKRREVGCVGIDTRYQTLSGIKFPMTEKALEAIRGLDIDRHNYVQLKIDLEKEIIHVECACTVSIEKLPEKVPTRSARYHLYRFKHTHEEENIESLVFIYSMPGYECSIKERMLYSSCKHPLLNTLECELGLVISKKLEIESGSELTEEYLRNVLHPKMNLYRPKFDKPKGPPNRGAKRLTKPQQSNESQN